MKGGLRDTTAEDISVKFHEVTELTPGTPEFLKSIYIRTAYRNDPDFAINQIQKVGPILGPNTPNAKRLIDNDVRVSETSNEWSRSP